MSAVRLLKAHMPRLKVWFVILLVPTLLYGCFKENKQGTEQAVDPSAPDKIKQLVPKYVKSCAPCGGVIHQGEWNGRTIYTYGCNGPACDCFYQVYDMNGDKIALDSTAYRAFLKESKRIKIIWACKD